MQFGVSPRSSGPLARKLSLAHRQGELMRIRDQQDRAKKAEADRIAEMAETKRQLLIRREDRLRFAKQAECESSLGDFARAQKIKRDVAEKHRLTRLEIESHRRTPKIVRPRHEAMYRIAMETGLSYPRIGRMFGGKDHTSVLHAIYAHASRHDPMLPLPRGLTWNARAQRRRAA